VLQLLLFKCNAASQLHSSVWLGSRRCLQAAFDAMCTHLHCVHQRTYACLAFNLRTIMSAIGAGVSEVLTTLYGNVLTQMVVAWHCRFGDLEAVEDFIAIGKVNSENTQ
jgi:hypothetical protein